MSSAPSIRTGGMRQRANLQTKSRSADGGGGGTVSWSTERKIWCDIQPLSGTQRLEGMQRQSTVTHQISIRYRDDVDPLTLPEKRIQYGNEVFNIVAAWRPREIPEFVRMLAERGGAT